MAITANMTTSEGIALTNAYCNIPTAYVKKFDGDWTVTSEEKDEDGNVTKEEVWTQSEASFKLIYDVFIYVDKTKRDHKDNEQYKLKNNHIDHFKTDYDITANGNPIALAYENLKDNDNLSNVKDA